MNIKNLVEKKLRDMSASPGLKEEIAGLVQDAVEHDDLFMLTRPVCVFHEGTRYNTAHLSDEEYEEFLGFVPNVIVDDEGYVDNIEYLTEPQVYRIMKRWGILSLVSRILEAKEVVFDRLWELVSDQLAPFELKEALVFRGCHAINEWDIETLKGEVSYTVEGQELTVQVSADGVQKLLDSWSITDLVKELIG